MDILSTRCISNLHYQPKQWLIQLRHLWLHLSVEARWHVWWVPYHTFEFSESSRIGKDHSHPTVFHFRINDVYFFIAHRTISPLSDRCIVRKRYISSCLSHPVVPSLILPSCILYENSVWRAARHSSVSLFRSFWLQHSGRRELIIKFIVLETWSHIVQQTSSCSLWKNTHTTLYTFHTYFVSSLPSSFFCLVPSTFPFTIGSNAYLPSCDLSKTLKWGQTFATKVVKQYSKELRVGASRQSIGGWNISTVPSRHHFIHDISRRSFWFLPLHIVCIFLRYVLHNWNIEWSFRDRSFTWTGSGLSCSAHAHFDPFAMYPTSCPWFFCTYNLCCLQCHDLSYSYTAIPRSYSQLCAGQGSAKSRTETPIEVLCGPMKFASEP